MAQPAPASLCPSRRPPFSHARSRSCRRVRTPPGPPDREGPFTPCRLQSSSRLPSPPRHADTCPHARRQDPAAGMRRRGARPGLGTLSTPGQNGAGGSGSCSGARSCPRAENQGTDPKPCGGAGPHGGMLGTDRQREPLGSTAAGSSHANSGMGTAASNQDPSNRVRASGTGVWLCGGTLTQLSGGTAANLHILAKTPQSSPSPKAVGELGDTAAPQVQPTASPATSPSAAGASAVPEPSRGRRGGTKRAGGSRGPFCAAESAEQREEGGIPPEIKRLRQLDTNVKTNAAPSAGPGAARGRRSNFLLCSWIIIFCRG